MGRGTITDTPIQVSRRAEAREEAWLARARQGIANLGLETYEVGGSIRDELNGRPAKDLDVCVVGVSEAELLAKLNRHGKVNPLEVAGKTIGARIYADWTPREGIELALARREQSTGPGHKDFDVVAAPDVDLEEDLHRRDFTCNALARTINPDGSAGEIIDHHGGLNDIKNGVLRAVGPTTIAEDPLRVLRGLARMANDGSTPDQETVTAMHEQLDKLGPDGELSSEREFEELQKMFKGKYAADALRFARDQGIFSRVFPELAPMVGFKQESKYHDLAVDDHCFKALEKACQWNAPQSVRWASLLHDCGKPLVAFRGEDGHLHYYADPDQSDSLSHEEKGAQVSQGLMRRLRAPKELEDKVTLLVREHMYGEDRNMEKRSDRKNAYKARKMIQKIGRDNIDDLLLLRRCDTAGKGKERERGWDKDFIAFEALVAKEKRSPLHVKELAISGHQLLELGLQGPEIGNVQRELLQRVLSEPEHNNTERLLDWSHKLASKEIRGRS